MFKSYKGRIGYLKKQTVRQGLFTLVMLMVSAGIFVTGWIVTKSPKNLLTIASVLGMLPVSKSLVSFIMYIRAEKFTCDSKIVDAALGTQGDNNNGILMFDSYMTSYDKVFPVKCTYIKNGCLIGLMAEGKSSCNDAKDYLVDYMGKNSISGITIKYFNDEQKFLNRFKELAALEIEYSEPELSLMALINNLTL